MATTKTDLKFSDDDLKRYNEFIKIFNTVYPQNSKNTRNRNFTLDLQGGNPALSAIGDSITATGNVFSAFGRAFGDKDPKGLAGAYALGGNLFWDGGLEGDWNWDKNVKGMKGFMGNIKNNAGAIGDVAKGAVGLVKNFSNMSQLGVSKEEIDAVKSANMNTGKMYSDYDALDQAMSSHRDKGHVSWRDLMANGGPLNHYAYGGWTQDVGNTFNAAGQGAKAGSHFGPIGSAVGAGLGVLSSGLGIWARKRKAKREARRINRWNDYGNARDARGFGDSATQIAEEGINEALANYAALGGPLEYSLKSRALDIAQDAVNNESITDDDEESGVSIFAKGGKIHIKEKNKGKFGAAAKKAGMSTQAYARKILANKDKYSPTLVKRANFARNAAKWKHADGGPMDEQEVMEAQPGTVYDYNGRTVGYAGGRTADGDAIGIDLTTGELVNMTTGQIGSTKLGEVYVTPDSQKGESAFNPTAPIDYFNAAVSKGINAIAPAASAVADACSKYPVLKYSPLGMAINFAGTPTGQKAGNVVLSLLSPSQYVGTVNSIGNAIQSGDVSQLKAPWSEGNYGFASSPDDKMGMALNEMFDFGVVFPSGGSAVEAVDVANQTKKVEKAAAAAANEARKAATKTVRQNTRKLRRYTREELEQKPFKERLELGIDPYTGKLSQEYEDMMHDAANVRLNNGIKNKGYWNVEITPVFDVDIDNKEFRDLLKTKGEEHLRENLERAKKGLIDATPEDIKNVEEFFRNGGLGQSDIDDFFINPDFQDFVLETFSKTEAGKKQIEAAKKAGLEDDNIKDAIIKSIAYNINYNAAALFRHQIHPLDPIITPSQKDYMLRNSGKPLPHKIFGFTPMISLGHKRIDKRTGNYKGSRRIALDHERGHIATYPTRENVSDDLYNAADEYFKNNEILHDYFVEKDFDELGRRVEQIKNMYLLQPGEKLSWDDLIYGLENYTRLTGVNNYIDDMLGFIKSLKDPKLQEEFMNHFNNPKNAYSIVPPLLIGTAGAAATTQQAEGGFLNHYAFGGNLGTNGADFSNGNIEVNAGGSHEENPNGGVQMGVDPNGVPNLVEQGELINNDYVYSDRLVVPGSYRGKYGNRRGKGYKGGTTFAKAAKKASRESMERPNDPISKRGLQTQLSQLAQQQELVRAQQRAQNAINQLAVQQSKAMMQPGARIRAIGGLILNPFNHYGNFNPLAHYGNYNPVANKYEGTDSTTNDTQQMVQSDQTINWDNIDWTALDDWLAAHPNQSPFTYPLNFDNDYWGYDLAQPAKNAEKSTKQKYPIFDTTDKTIVPYGGTNYLWSRIIKHMSDNGQLTDDDKKAIEKLSNKVHDSNPSYPEIYDEKTGTVTDKWDDIFTYDLTGKTDDFSYGEAISPTLKKDLNNSYNVYIGVSASETPSQSALEMPAAADNNGSPTQQQDDAGNNGGTDSDGGTEDKEKAKDIDLPFTLDDELWKQGFPSRFMGTMVGSDMLGITNRPNYKFANQLLGASNQTGFERVNNKPVAGYMPYRRLDPTRFITPMQQDYAGMNRYLAQNAGMNANAANAGMMAAQQQLNNAIGETRQQVADQDWEQLLGTKQFNFGINQLNAQNALDAAKSNQQGRLAAANSRLENLREGYKMATDAFNISEAGRAQNISQFLEEKGNYGKAKFNFVQAILDAQARANAGIISKADLTKYLEAMGVLSNLG